MADEGRSRERYGEAFWRTHHEAWHQSDLNQREYCEAHGLEFRRQETTFFLSRETIIPTPRPGMALWREKLFAFLSRNSQPATAFFGLPANRVVELGMKIEI